MLLCHCLATLVLIIHSPPFRDTCLQARYLRVFFVTVLGLCDFGMALWNSRANQEPRIFSVSGTLQMRADAATRHQLQPLLTVAAKTNQSELR